MVRSPSMKLLAAAVVVSFAAVTAYRRSRQHHP